MKKWNSCREIGEKCGFTKDQVKECLRKPRCKAQKGQEAEHREQEAYGKKYSPLLMFDSKKAAFRMLNEDIEQQTMHRIMRQAQEKQQIPHKRKDKSDDMAPVLIDILFQVMLSFYLICFFCCHTILLLMKTGCKLYSICGADTAALPTADTLRVVWGFARVYLHFTGFCALSAVDALVLIYPVAEHRDLVKKRVDGSKRADIFAKRAVNDNAG